MPKFGKKRRPKDLELDSEAKAEEIERQRLEHELEIRRNADAEIKRLKLKVKFAREKSRELDRQFRAKRGNFPDQATFMAEYRAHQARHAEIIHQLEEKLHTAQQAYRDRFETGGYKIKRWFYGLGKEFSRITWLDRKGLGWGFVTVGSISIILAVIFLIIDVIFSAGYF